MESTKGAQEESILRFLENVHSWYISRKAYQNTGHPGRRDGRDLTFAKELPKNGPARRSRKMRPECRSHFMFSPGGGKTLLLSPSPGSPWFGKCTDHKPPDSPSTSPPESISVHCSGSRIGTEVNVSSLPPANLVKAR
jgi:hypothetical protein